MLKRYNLPSIKIEGWAVIVIDTTDGFFATDSDFGNYVYRWTSPGMEFRQFLTQLQPDYLYGKLMMGRPDTRVWDEEKTEANVRLHLEEKNKESIEMTGKGWARFEEELEILRERTPMDKDGFEAWESETQLTDVWEFVVYSQEPQCTIFCERIWPRFVTLLKEELEAEKKDLEVLRVARPEIISEAQRDIARMTGPDRNG